MFYGDGEYTYKLVDNWAKPVGIKSLIDVVGITIGCDDRVYVLNRSKYPMIVLNSDGNQLSCWDQDLFKRPHGSYLAHDGSIYCTDDYSHVVYKFSPDGSLLMTIGNRDQPADTGHRLGTDIFERISFINRAGPPFNQPTGVAISSSMEIFVSDGYGNARVHRFSAQGELLHSWGEPGGGPGQFRLPHSIWVDPYDRVWVADRENHRLQIFDTEGRFIDQWTDVIRPTHVFMDANDTVYVAELCRRISIFSLDGILLARWGNEAHLPESRLLVGPHTIAVDSLGNIYVGEVASTFGKTDRGLQAILKFARA